MSARRVCPHSARILFVACVVAAGGSLAPSRALGQEPPVVDSVRVRLSQVGLRDALEALGRYLDRPLVIGPVPEATVTVETADAIPRTGVLDLLKGLARAYGLEVASDSGYFLVTTPAAQAASPDPRLPLDRLSSSTDGPARLFALQLSHARADAVAATVNALYGRAAAFGELGGRAPTLGSVLRDQQVPSSDLRDANRRAVTPPGADAEFKGDVTIVPDARTNSLLIRASESDFALVEAAVRHLDVRPPQVLIEVLVVEARRDRSIGFGVDADLPSTRIPGSANTTATATTTGIGLADFTLAVMGIGGSDLDVVLRAAATRGDVQIVSRPVVLATNNETAEIVVGSQRPFVQVSRALPTDAPIRDQIVQYRDVGTRLSVRPTVSADDYVQLDVVQEVNAATSEVAFDAPVISTRSLTTQLLIRNGQTVVLGGLTDRQRDATQGGIPLLSSIPWLGGVFGRASRRSTDTELFLFITTRVLRTDADVDSATSPLQKRAERIDPFD